MVEKAKDVGMYILDRYGVPMFILAAVLWFGGTRVVEPLVQAHASYLNATAERIAKLEQKAENHDKFEDTQTKALEEIASCMREMKATMQPKRAGDGI